MFEKDFKRVEGSWMNAPLLFPGGFFLMMAFRRPSATPVRTTLQQVSISSTVDDETSLDPIIDDLKLIAGVEFSPGKAIFCVVRDGLRKFRVLCPGYSQLFKRIRFLSAWSLLVDWKSRDIRCRSTCARVGQALHDDFFPKT